MKRLALALALAIVGTAGVLAPQTADAQYYSTRHYDDYGYGYRDLYRRHEVIWIAGRPYHRFTREPLVRVHTRWGIRYAPIDSPYAYRYHDRRPGFSISFGTTRYDRPYYRRYYYDRWY